MRCVARWRSRSLPRASSQAVTAAPGVGVNNQIIGKALTSAVVGDVFPVLVQDLQRALQFRIVSVVLSPYITIVRVRPALREPGPGMGNQTKSEHQSRSDPGEASCTK